MHLLSLATRCGYTQLPAFRKLSQTAPTDLRRVGGAPCVSIWASIDTWACACTYNMYNMYNIAGSHTIHACICRVLVVSCECRVRVS